MKILLLHNDPIDSALIRCVLRCQDYDVVQLSNAEEAVRTLRQPPSMPAMVLLDGALLRPTALELCRLFRQVELPLYILLLSTKWDPFEFVASKSAGVDDYLVDPVNCVGVLLDRVKLGLLELNRRSGTLPPVANARPSTILLLEGNQIVSRLVKRTLWLAGFEVVSAATAAEAVSAFEEHRDRVALLIADHYLRDGSSGRVAAEIVRASRADLKVLQMIGVLNEPLADAQANTSFLLKPFRADALVNTVKRILAPETPW